MKHPLSGGWGSRFALIISLAPSVVRVEKRGTSRRSTLIFKFSTALANGLMTPMTRVRSSLQLPACDSALSHPCSPGHAPAVARGFTLIEIMVVITILGVLAALIVPRVVGRTDDARIAAAKQDIASIMQALKLYRLDNGRYPTTDQGLQALITRPTTEPMPSNWKQGGYLERSTRARRSMGRALQVSESRRARRDRRVLARPRPCQRWRAEHARTPTSGRGSYSSDKVNPAVRWSA